MRTPLNTAPPFNSTSAGSVQALLTACCRAAVLPCLLGMLGVLQAEPFTFHVSAARATFLRTDGDLTVAELQGGCTFMLEVGAAGEAADGDGDGLDEAPVILTDLDMQGDGPYGPASLTLQFGAPSTGFLEELNNDRPGLLDFPPFADAGRARCIVQADVEVTHGDTYRLGGPLYLNTVASSLPPGADESLILTRPVPLLQENGDPSDLTLIGLECFTETLPEAPGFPELSASAAGNELFLSVNEGVGPFTIQQTPALDSGYWFNAAETSDRQISVPISERTAFVQAVEGFTGPVDSEVNDSDPMASGVGTLSLHGNTLSLGFTYADLSAPLSGVLLGESLYEIDSHFLADEPGSSGYVLCHLALAPSEIVALLQNQFPIWLLAAGAPAPEVKLDKKEKAPDNPFTAVSPGGGCQCPVAVGVRIKFLAEVITTFSDVDVAEDTFTLGVKGPHTVERKTEKTFNVNFSDSRLDDIIDWQHNEVKVTITATAYFQQPVPDDCCIAGTGTYEGTATITHSGVTDTARVPPMPKQKGVERFMRFPLGTCSGPLRCRAVFGPRKIDKSFSLPLAPSIRLKGWIFAEVSSHSKN